MPIRIDVPETLSRRWREAGWWTDATLADWLAANVATRGDALALRQRIEPGQADRELSWSQLADRVRAFAVALDRLGIARGEVVAVQLPNVIEFLVAYLAITSRGAVMQTVHMPYREAELQGLLAHSGAVAVICVAQAKDWPAAERLLAMRAGCPALKHVIALGAGADAKGSGVPEGALPFAQLCADAGDAVPAPVTLGGADPFLLLYTSGTTSAPKGVPHAYQNFLANSRLSAGELSVGPDDRLMTAAPFSHLYGLFSFNMALSVGAASILLPAFSPLELARAFHEARPTLAFAAPAHIAACLGMKLFEGRDLASLRYVQLSGSNVPPALGRAFEPLLPNGKVMQLWGMTELQAGAYTRLADSEPVRIETTGRASPGTELRVLRDDGTPVAPDEEGELQMRGPSLFAGYLDNPQATRAAMTDDGFFRTGDLACVDAQGNVRLSGRTKEIINRGGVKFNPVDVENLLMQHPAVDMAAIIPIPDPVLGERACAFVTLRAGQALDMAGMQAFLEGRGVSKLRWPERLEVIAAMPFTPTRKIIKGELARELARRLSQA